MEHGVRFGVRDRTQESFITSGPDAYTLLSNTDKSVFILFNITDHQKAAIVFGTIFITDIIKDNM